MQLEDPWLGVAYDRRELRSFDGGILGACRVYRPDRYAVFQRKFSASGALIARGSGLSYAAASFVDGGVTVDMRLFDRILSFDVDTGYVEVESGITLIALCNFLIALGRYLPVQPGHGQISVGGCIAADVHGKNPAKDGTFASQVLSVRLYHPAHGLSEISRECEGDLFEATCGGYGLTGIIVSARLATSPLPGNVFLVRALPVRDPAHGAIVMREMSGIQDLVYSWHDFFSSAGKGIVFIGRFSTDVNAKNVPSRGRSISADWRARMPFRIQGRLVGRLQNKVFYALSGRKSAGRSTGLRHGFFPVQGKEAYFLAFGAAGFHEHQAIVPDAAFPAYIAEIRRLAKKRGDLPIVLASGKSFAGSSTLLRFGGVGTCLALNIPRSREAGQLVDDLNQLVAEIGGRPNIIKDSTLRRRTVEACYPEYKRFRDFLQRWDPGRLFQSELSRRLEL